MRCAEKPSLREASCCRVEVENGGDGLRRRCLRSIDSTLSAPEAAAFGVISAGPPAAVRSVRSTLRASVSLVKLNCSTFLPPYSMSRTGKLWALCSPSASSDQYSCGMKA